MMGILISLLVLLLVIILVNWIMANIPLPPPVKMIAWVIIGVVFLIWLINLLGAGAGWGWGPRVWW